MLSTITINWFKPFSTVTVPVLTPITIVGGPNNSGKTSLLEAIFLIFDRQNPELLLRSLGWRGFTQLRGPADRLFSHAFHDYDLDRDITISGEYAGERFTLTLSYVRRGGEQSVRMEPEFGSSSVATDQISSSDGIKITYDIEGEFFSDFIHIDDGNLKSAGILTQKPSPDAKYQGLRVRNSASEDAEQLGHIEIEGQEQHIVEFCREFFPEIRSLNSLPLGGTSMIFADVGLPKKIPLPSLGDGASRIVSYYLAAYSVRNGGILLLDEVGSGIHHSLLPRLWRAICSIADHFKCQIVATTHSYECLVAAAQENGSLFASKFSYVRLGQNKGSREVHVSTYSHGELHAAIEQEWEVR